MERKTCELDTEIPPCEDDSTPYWTPWKEWGDCEADCGKRGKRKRKRDCVVTSKRKGKCKGTDTEEGECHSACFKEGA